MKVIIFLAGIIIGILVGAGFLINYFVKRVAREARYRDEMKNR